MRPNQLLIDEGTFPLSLNHKVAKQIINLISIANNQNVKFSRNFYKECAKIYPSIHPQIIFFTQPTTPVTKNLNMKIQFNDTKFLTLPSSAIKPVPVSRKTLLNAYKIDLK